jgi:putative endonuclease
MYYRYILKSNKDDSLYIGYTNDLRRRLKEHNTSFSKATKSRLPLKLVYYEAYLSEKDAKEREFKLKRFSSSYIHLKNRIKNSLVFSKRGV